MATLRVTAGSIRGRRIPLPGREVRPTSERAREAFFNIVGERISGARFGDFFAGSGIFSFEAVSRGAHEAIAVDASRRQVAAIARLAADLHVPVRAIAADLPAGIKLLPREVFDVIYADPPYEYSRHDDFLMALDADLMLAPDAIVAIEHRRRTEPFTATPSKLRFQRRAEYGEIWISFFIT